MVFSSLYFLFAFLPISFLLYFLTPKKYRNYILFIESLFFYTFGEGKMVVLLLFSSLFNYFNALWIEKNRKFGMISAVVVNLGLLFYFKYTDFAFANYYRFCLLFHIEFEQNFPSIALPIGISFFTFQALSYCVDVYYRRIVASRSYINFATYLCMFPQLVAGPIVRYSDIEGQLVNRSSNQMQIVDGIKRFVIGLSRKVLIANPLSRVADEIFAMQVDDMSTLLAWGGAFAYMMQIYFDFSGYSDMAIGLGKIFGFNFLENFNFPYISKSIREFWRRWHISLSSWFRDYLYIPLGGNRRGERRTYINLLIVFFATGLWHGASWNFIVWGLFHGLFLILERVGFNKILEKMPSFFQHLYVLSVVLIGWVFFRTNSLSVAFAYIRKMFAFDSGGALASYQLYTSLTFFEIFIFLFAIFFSIPWAKRLIDRLKCSLIFQWSALFVLVILYVLSVVFINSSAYNPFIYFRF